MNDDFEITSNISFSRVYRKSFEDFLRNSIRLIINSRKKDLNQNINRTLSFETDLNDNQINNSLVLFEDLSFDSLSTITNSKSISISKQHIIDFFGIDNNKNKLLLERWNFNFNENNNYENEFYFKKKLVFLFRSIYVITRILPCNKLKNMNNIIIDFQSYQNFKKTNFIFEPKELIHISNKKLNNINITVEYITINQIENYFNQIEKKINKQKPIISDSLSFKKTNSFEILNFQEENPKLIENNFSKKNIRKLSYDEEIKKDYNIKNKENKKKMYLSFDLDNDLELIESEDNVILNLNITEENETLSSIYKNLRAKNINEENSSGTKSSKENIQNKRVSHYRTADTIDSNSSLYNFVNENDVNNTFDLNINSEKNNNENLIVNKKNIINEQGNIKIYKNVRLKYFELKEKIFITKQFNINKLFSLINDNH